ncbi:hypothetical protein H2198_003787 [Neophaeococcomyces mojaviensis]|uniref:Uncharacterized protein n=1 Tax=Neophaeococcomyces mojaviensis TaxID=3383035 RepID=A0ACC3AAJ1_9EURO|nr:hypothetical protein H2198_003787 [Knufia sp. JES_112]
MDPATTYNPLDSRTAGMQSHPNNLMGKHAARGWRPQWMRRSVLFAFLLCFITILVTLEVIDLVSLNNDGLASTNMKLYYLWTYGPTAILTLVQALWYRVDYRVRQMTPWILMFKRPQTTAARSIFLDYISPMVPEILWQSLKNGDFLVTASTLIVNLGTLLIIISTGLLSLMARPMTLTDVPYQVTSRFVNNGSKLFANSKLPGNVIDGVDTMGLHYPLGTTPEVAYQPFVINSSDVSSDAIQRASVDVLTFDLDCEEAQFEIENWSYSWRWPPCWMNTTIDASPTANVTMYITAGNCRVRIGTSYAYGDDGDQGNFAFFDSEICDGGDYDNPDDIRMAFGFGKAQQKGVVGPHPTRNGCNTTAPLAQIEIVQSKQWICKTHMSAVKGNITFNATDLAQGILPDIVLDPNAQRKTFPNVSSWLFNSAIGTVSMAPFVQPAPLSVKLMGVNENDAQLDGAEIRILRAAGNATASDLLDTDLFLDLAERYYKQVTVQIAHLTLTEGDNAIVQGTAIVSHDRLIVRELPLRMMQALLGIMILLVVYMIICMPRGSIAPHDPARLEGLAMILKQNSTILPAFSRTGALHLHALRQLHLSSQYKSFFIQDGTLDRQRKFKIDHNTWEMQQDPVDETQQVNWWRPLAITAPVRLAMFSLVAGLIAALQVLLAYSNRNHGLVTVPPANNEHLAWSIVPAFVMAAIAIYFRTLSSMYKTFAPYCLLRGGSNASKTLSRNYLSMTDIEVLLHSTRDRQAATFFMTLSTLLAAFLTIIVSGVFSALPVPLSYDANLNRQSWFSTAASSDNGTTGNNAAISGLVLAANLSYPDWTYQNLALASYKVGDTDIRPTSSGHNTTIRSIIPAIRSTLNCTLYTTEQIKGLAYYPALGGPGYRGIIANSLGSASCAGNSTQVNQLASGGDSNGDFIWSSFASNNRPGCPLLNYYWGYMGPTNGSWLAFNLTYARGLACYETVQQVDVDTVLSIPNLAIDPSNPPRPLEDTAKLFTTAATVVPYEQLPVFGSTNNNLGAGFYGAMESHFGILEKDLGNVDRVDDIVSAIRYTHGIIRAQQYNVALRTTNPPVEGTSPNSTLIGTITDAGRYRLVQNTISTGVLCGLLGAMVICATVSSLIMSTKHVLPKNPSTIGAMISLLADSNLFGKIPKSAVNDESPLKTSGLFDGSIFRMGWFTRKRDGQRIFTINVLDDHDEVYDEWDAGDASVTDADITEYREAYLGADESVPLKPRPTVQGEMRRGFTAQSP